MYTYVCRIDCEQPPVERARTVVEQHVPVVGTYRVEGLPRCGLGGYGCQLVGRVERLECLAGAAQAA